MKKEKKNRAEKKKNRNHCKKEDLEYLLKEEAGVSDCRAIGTSSEPETWYIGARSTPLATEGFWFDANPSLTHGITFYLQLTSVL